jgi:hypothetical protein
MGLGYAERDLLEAAVGCFLAGAENASQPFRDVCLQAMNAPPSTYSESLVGYSELICRPVHLLLHTYFHFTQFHTITAITW